jgi:predicted PurR-regulated permease PerM
MDKANIKAIDVERDPVPSPLQMNHPPEQMADPNAPQIPLRIHVDARGFALVVLSTLAIVFALQWAQKFLVPLLFGILVAYTLNPVLTWLQKMRIPRVIGASLLMALIISGSIWAANSLRGEFLSIVDRLPAATHKLSVALGKLRDGQPTTIEQMQAVATEIEKATNQAAGVNPPSQKAAPPAPAQSVFKLREWLWASSMGAVGFVSQMTVVLFLAFFLLISGDTFKRKMVKLAGPSLSKKKITLQILSDINTSIQQYMFMLLVTNSLLALLMWGAFHLIGLENAGAWAVAAGLTHIVPYFGPIFITAATGLSAFMQFESFSMVLLVVAVSLGIATLVGTFVTTWMTGKIAKMNPAAVFIGLLFWGWLWGVWGFLLGIPIIVIVKVISEHIEELHSVAELLGD